MTKKKQLPFYENIEMTDLSSDGTSLVRIDGVVTFVRWVVPGDVVNLQITKKKSSFMEAQAVQLVRPSTKRIAPLCKHFGICGGCNWQILVYEEQLKFKQQQVYDAMQRIGKIENPPVLPILGAKNIYYYRNKLEFAFAFKHWLTEEQMQQNIPFAPGVGFHISGHFDKVLDIQQCHLMPAMQDDIRNTIRDYALQNGLTFYNEHEHSGLLRNIIIRNNNNDEWMVVIVFGEFERVDNNPTLGRGAEDLLRYIQRTFSKIVSLQYCFNAKMNDTISDLPVYVWYGKSYITETLEALHFKVGPKSFYQTNNEQILTLYTVIRSYILLEHEDKNLPVIYDLYTGTGTIALFIARYAKKVIGIEYVSEAIEDARCNAIENSITNTVFVSGDMKTTLTRDFIDLNGHPDIIITDPPRAGMHPDVLQTIIETHCPKIIYVSCNPSTQARDITVLSEFYNIKSLQPVDMFPHTHHVENVALLEIKK